MLVRGAAHEGDAESAAAWLQHFGPDYDDLESESEWRIALAMEATLSKRYARALQVLGMSGTEISIHPNLEGLATGLRASCLSRLGKQLDALFLIHAEVKRVPSIRGALTRMAQRYPHLALDVLLERNPSPSAGKHSWLPLLAFLSAGLSVVGLLAYVTSARDAARSFVQTELAAVRKDAARYLASADDPETRAAYLAIAESTSDSVSLFNSSRSRGDFSHSITEHCISADLSAGKGSRTVAILVREEDDKFSITAMSMTRQCSCRRQHSAYSCGLR